MDGFWIYHTASADHTPTYHANENLSMIDESTEGDDCAYVIGNNARHSGQFLTFLYTVKSRVLACLI